MRCLLDVTVWTGSDALAWPRFRARVAGGMAEKYVVFFMIIEGYFNAKQKSPIERERWRGMLITRVVEAENITASQLS